MKQLASILITLSALVLSSCKTTAQLSKVSTQAQDILLSDSNIAKGHIGICIFDPETGKYLYTYNANKYFTPASNTKLFSLYAGLKYLGDSVPTFDVKETVNEIEILPKGDPTFLHPDFLAQPAFEYLKNLNKKIFGFNTEFKTTAYGNGWAWNDYTDSYMNERSAFPIFGNNVTFFGRKKGFSYFPKQAVENFEIFNLKEDSISQLENVVRDFRTNNFVAQIGKKGSSALLVPFITSIPLSYKIFSDTLGKNIDWNIDYVNFKKERVLYSRPTDSLFIPMMHNSDNFFAEQTLLMAGNARIGYMSTDDIIDTLLKTDLAALPDKPRWVDGSGLSRYNLFTPADMVYLLNKLKTEFDFERIKRILPTGGQGTLKSYYNNIPGKIFAKTGTLSNNQALSGYLITEKGKLLIFSVMVNNYMSSATPVRKAIEKFLLKVRQD